MKIKNSQGIFHFIKRKEIFRKIFYFFTPFIGRFIFLKNFFILFSPIFPQKFLQIFKKNFFWMNFAEIWKFKIFQSYCEFDPFDNFKKYVRYVRQ